jgi:hypothetical protein
MKEKSKIAPKKRITSKPTAKKITKKTAKK